MAELLTLKTFHDNRGSLTVLDRIIPFEVKRLFYIYGVDESSRGGHRHHETRQAAICIQGSCEIVNHNGEKQELFLLDTPDKCLILESRDWHIMQNFKPNTILLVLASTAFDPSDYIFEPYDA
ncbi:sugar 3,4-ketoisomerase [Arcicella lustrica]|uniref:FdtA/QdtA family cupin domain-containing protein n=1 Tax=Arcicella lustrica TaxID=2984196 RepID=A0ABU5SQB9_9BACT|nr:FdtA/QdtA family cupin domain-containing protein [Arcicella sp. DC25W]MEA5429500.1 FdtA/QdtA family cupin domain-containing protein [Arcicella sp. DC25W]